MGGLGGVVGSLVGGSRGVASRWRASPARPAPRTRTGPHLPPTLHPTPQPRSHSTLTYDDVPFPHDGVAALADVNPDFPGSCGRCYEVKCMDGLLLGNNHLPIDTTCGGEEGGWGGLLLT